MNPPPSYHEILNLLNKSKLNEMKLIDENERLVKELENVKMELEMVRKAHMVSKQTEYKLKKIISKI
jgi:hypothetical protein